MPANKCFIGTTFVETDIFLKPLLRVERASISVKPHGAKMMEGGREVSRCGTFELFCIIFIQNTYPVPAKLSNKKEV